jgi:hypothetical protein
MPPAWSDLINLTLDGSGNNVTNTEMVGVFYQDSFGTMSHLIIQNYNGAVCGVAVWLEGGSNKPSVTLENSYLQGLGCGGESGWHARSGTRAGLLV